MSSKFLMLLFYFSTTHLFGQNEIKRINFVLVIDGEVPIETIHNGYYVIRDSNDVVVRKIPFFYKVGGLELSISDYKKLQDLPKKFKLRLEFDYVWQLTPKKSIFYESSIFLNNDYIIMYIYNKSKKENSKKFEFGDKTYVVRIESSTWNTIMNYRSGWHRKHKTESY